MIKFYGVETDGYYLIIISSERPKIGKTYIGWKPKYLNEAIEFSSLREYTRKIVPWWYFQGFYRFGSYNRMGTVTITSTTKVPKSDPNTETSCEPLIDWLNENIRVSEKNLKEMQVLDYPEHWDATYIQYYD